MVIGLKELFTPVSVNGEQRKIKFSYDRSHPKLKNYNGIFETDDPEVQEAMEADPRFNKKWKRIKNLKH